MLSFAMASTQAPYDQTDRNKAVFAVKSKLLYHNLIWLSCHICSHSRAFIPCLQRLSLITSATHDDSTNQLAEASQNSLALCLLNHNSAVRALRPLIMRAHLLFVVQ